MAVRKIFINTGDTIHVHTIHDEDEPRTMKSFNDQLLIHQRTMLIKVESVVAKGLLSFVGVAPSIAIKDSKGEVVAFLKRVEGDE